MTQYAVLSYDLLYLIGISYLYKEKDFIKLYKGIVVRVCSSLVRYTGKN